MARKATLIDEDAKALGVPADPPPDGAPTSRRKSGSAWGRGKITLRDATGRAVSKKDAIAKVQGEIETYLYLATAAWMLSDPECAAIAEQQIPAVAERVTALIARSDRALAVAAKTGVVGDIIGILQATLPVLRAVWAAHGPGGGGHKTTESVDDAERYPAYRR